MDTPDQNLEKMAALGRVTRSLIHDFNNSLAAIMGHADFLLSDLAEGSEQHLFAENIKKAAVQLQGTLDQIKGFAGSGYEPPTKVDTPPAPVTYPPRSILLVEDRTMVLKTIETMLQRGNHVVETASDGFTALDMIRENPKKYDLLITDYTMPHLNGRDLIAEIRQDFKTLPVIIMSGDVGTLSELQKNRANHNIFVLPKPIIASDLAHTIELTQATKKKLHKATPTQK